MFGDTDLPLALIMEEILEWEKKPGLDENEGEPSNHDDKTSSRGQ